MNTDKIKRYHIIASGRVQGVGYRYFTRENALNYKLTGWVKNRFNGTVEAEVQGYLSFLNRFIEILKEGPLSSHVDSVVFTPIPIVEDEHTFTIK